MVNKAMFCFRATLQMAVLAVVLSACGSPGAKTQDRQEITVAAAANLTDVFGEIARNFEHKNGIDVRLSFGSTAQLAQQIEHGAPFDVFAAADTEHVDGLVRIGKLSSATRQVYARGLLSLWIPKGDTVGVRSLHDLTKPAVRTVAIATPSLAPYGRAAVEALQRLSIWSEVQPKVVYSNNISMAKQFAISGNADVAFTAYSLVLNEPGRVIKVDESLYDPIDQAIAVLTTSSKGNLARQFTGFVLAREGQEILKKYGYLSPEIDRK